VTRRAIGVVTLSLGVPNFGGWVAGDWRALLDVAHAAENAGVDRIVVSDHVVLGHGTDAYAWGRFPTAPDGPWLEPLSCLTAIAAVTTRLRLSTGILIAPLRPAAVLAKTVATLDVLSRGRVDLGVGVGWHHEEYDALGLDFTARGRLLDETMAACRALWSELPASYASESTTFVDTFCSPQPAQDRLPVWFSGTLNARNLRRIVELGDGWIPIMGATTDDIRAGAARLRAATDRRLDVQAPLRPVRTDNGTLDLDATMAGAPELVEAGVTNVYVNVAMLAAAPAEAPAVLARAVAAFRSATS
jgi:probable F420-dependent oxidoreductase